MSHVIPIPESEAVGETAQLYAAERDRVGYLPHYAQAFGHRPEVYRAWRQLNAAVKSPMTDRRYELVTLAAARELRSTYCSVAHGEILADLLAPDDVQDLARGEVPNALDDSERAIVAFAVKATRSPADITAADVEELRSHGLSEEEIFDVVLATAARCFFSTVLEATGTQADAVYAQRMDPGLRDALTVGRPIADQ